MEIVHYGINDSKPLPRTKRGKRRAIAKVKAKIRKLAAKIKATGSDVIWHMNEQQR